MQNGYRTYESGVVEALDDLWRQGRDDLFVGVAGRGLIVEGHLIHDVDYPMKFLEFP